MCFLDGVKADSQDDANSLEMHPAEIYARLQAEYREKKLQRWIKSQEKAHAKKKQNKLKAAIKRRLRALEVDQEEEFSDEDYLDDLDYDTLHVAFDPEKSPKFHC